MVKVPDLTGSSLDSAKNSLKSLGLKVGNVTRTDSKQPAGTVISQSPSGGTTEDGSAVDLVVSNGKAPASSSGKKDNPPVQEPSKQDGTGKK